MQNTTLQGRRYATNFLEIVHIDLEGALDSCYSDLFRNVLV